MKDRPAAFVDIIYYNSNLTETLLSLLLSDHLVLIFLFLVISLR